MAGAWSDELVAVVSTGISVLGYYFCRDVILGPEYMGMPYAPNPLVANVANTVEVGVSVPAPVKISAPAGPNLPVASIWGHPDTQCQSLGEPYNQALILRAPDRIQHSPDIDAWIWPVITFMLVSLIVYGIILCALKAQRQQLKEQQEQMAYQEAQMEEQRDAMVKLAQWYVDLRKKLLDDEAAARGYSEDLEEQLRRMEDDAFWSNVKLDKVLKRIADPASSSQQVDTLKESQELQESQRKTNSDLESRLQALEQQAVTDQNAANSEVQQLQTLLQSTMDQAASDRESYASSMEDLRGQLEESQEAVKSQLKVNANLESRLQETKKQAIANKDAVGDANRQLQTLLDINNDQVDDRAANASRIRDLEALLEKSQESEQAQHQMIVNLKSDFEGLKQEMAVDRDAAAASASENVQSLQKDIKDVQKHNEGLQKDIEELQKHKEGLQKHIGDLERQLGANEDAAKSRIKTLESALQASEASRVPQASETLQGKQIEDLKSELQALQASQAERITSLEDQLKQSKIFEDSQDEQIAAVKTLKAELQVSQALQTQTVHDLKAELKQSKDSQDAQDKYVKDLESKLQASQASKDSQFQRINGLGAQLQAFQALQDERVKDLETQLREAQEKLDEFSSLQASGPPSDVHEQTPVEHEDIVEHEGPVEHLVEAPAEVLVEPPAEAPIGTPINTPVDVPVRPETSVKEETPAAQDVPIDTVLQTAASSTLVSGSVDAAPPVEPAPISAPSKASETSKKAQPSTILKPTALEFSPGQSSRPTPGFAWDEEMEESLKLNTAAATPPLSTLGNEPASEQGAIAPAGNRWANFQGHIAQNDEKTKQKANEAQKRQGDIRPEFRETFRNAKGQKQLITHKGSTGLDSATVPVPAPAAVTNTAVPTVESHPPAESATTAETGPATKTEPFAETEPAAKTEPATKTGTNKRPPVPPVPQPSPYKMPKGGHHCWICGGIYFEDEKWKFHPNHMDHCRPWWDEFEPDDFLSWKGGQEAAPAPAYPPRWDHKETVHPEIKPDWVLRQEAKIQEWHAANQSGSGAPSTAAPPSVDSQTAKSEDPEEEEGELCERCGGTYFYDGKFEDHITRCEAWWNKYQRDDFAARPYGGALVRQNPPRWTMDRTKRPATDPNWLVRQNRAMDAWRAANPSTMPTREEVQAEMQRGTQLIMGESRAKYNREQAAVEQAQASRTQPNEPSTQQQGAFGQQKKKKNEKGKAPAPQTQAPPAQRPQPSAQRNQQQGFSRNTNQSRGGQSNQGGGNGGTQSLTAGFNSPQNQYQSQYESTGATGTGGPKKTPGGGLLGSRYAKK